MHVLAASHLRDANIGKGYKVFGADITVGEPLRELGCEAVQLDVTSPDSIRAFAERMNGETVDIVLNVAGTLSCASRPSFGPHPDLTYFRRYEAS
jgi:23S rRNA U2552 (ribose-2'-O)-methylase RlmE/FtsJ